MSKSERTVQTSLPQAVASRPFCPRSAADGGVTVTNNAAADVVLIVSMYRVATANVIPAAVANPSQHGEDHARANFREENPASDDDIDEDD